MHSSLTFLRSKSILYTKKVISSSPSYFISMRIWNMILHLFLTLKEIFPIIIEVSTCVTKQYSILSITDMSILSAYTFNNKRYFEEAYDKHNISSWYRNELLPLFYKYDATLNSSFYMDLNFFKSILQ